MSLERQTHFVLTDTVFYYPYYLAVVSAVHAQQFQPVNIWHTVPLQGRYLRALRERYPQVRFRPVAVADFPALRGRPAHWRAAHTKDYLTWKILADHGGLVLDLDMISLSEVTSLLGDRQVLLGLDFDNVHYCPNPYNSACVAAEANSWLARLLEREAWRLLQQRPEDFPWGATGPHLASEIARQHPAAVATPPFRTCGAVSTNEGDILWTPGQIAPEARTIHLFHKSNEGHFNDMAPEFVYRNGSRLAATLRERMTRWGAPYDPVPSWGPINWCNIRGQHYREMYRWLHTHNVRTILETGTNGGENALGMIRNTLAEEGEVSYYGFDLFEPYSAELEQREFSTGYTTPPSIETVWDLLSRQTRAWVYLVAGDSKQTLPNTPLPPLDYAYIDGGHSLDTTAADFNNVLPHLAPGGVIFLDDYFVDRDNVGCKLLVDGLDREQFDVTVFPEEDNYDGKLRTRLARVLRREPCV